MRVPSSTPAGMLTDSERSLRTRPAPPQLRHGFSMIRPAPWQATQVRSMVKKPWLALTLPLPWHDGQLIELEPFSPPLPWQLSHLTELGTRMVACLPEKASLRSISRL